MSKLSQQEVVFYFFVRYMCMISAYKTRKYKKIIENSVTEILLYLENLTICLYIR